MSIYKEIILDNYKHPKNRGKVKGYTHTAHVTNPLCGDEFTVYLKMKGTVIQGISYEGEGCAISTASSSLLSEKLKGEKLESIKDYEEYVQKLLGIPLSVGRLKCALLPLQAIEKALIK